MSYIPSRNEDGEYNKKNLKGEKAGWIEAFDYLINEGLDVLKQNILENKYSILEPENTREKLIAEFVDEIFESLKEYMDIEADEFNCGFAEEKEI